MIYNNTLETLPEGYLEKRKKAALIFIYSMYLFCIIQTLIEFGFVDFLDPTVIKFVGYFSYVISCIALVNAYSSRRTYNKIKMINHNEIKAFTKKEILLYSIPIILSAYFITLKLLIYFMLIGFACLSIDRFNRPIGYNGP